MEGAMRAAQQKLPTGQAVQVGQRGDSVSARLMATAAPEPLGKTSNVLQLAPLVASAVRMVAAGSAQSDAHEQPLSGLAYQSPTLRLMSTPFSMAPVLTTSGL